MFCFREETSIKVVKMLLPESGHSNHQSPEPPFPDSKDMLAKMDRWLGA